MTAAAASPPNAAAIPAVTPSRPSAISSPIVHAPRAAGASEQGLYPRRYSLAVQAIALAAFTLAFAGWLNETWLMLFDNPIWLNRYTEYAIILGFGVWRVFAERNRYTRRRLTVLVAMVTVFWWLIPWLVPMSEPYVGYLWGQPVFPSVHVPGTITFFLVLGAVFLFGRRVICGWNCPCVGIRETVGFAFRDRTVRGKWAWRLRHTKWFFFVFYAGVMVVTQYPPNTWTLSFVGLFYLLIGFTYFGTFFVAPLTGNRFYCRYLCPYGATFGLLNHAGFYDIRLHADKCNDCRRCEQVCDMGIPVWEQGKQFGRITGIEDCMGCARCVVSCPTDALEIRDVRNLFRPKLVQNGSYLMKAPKDDPAPRAGPAERLPAERTRDTREIHVPLSLDQIRQQAARCLDCGVPGCRNACPLGNRIPDWLRAAARGELRLAGEIMHSTSTLPEVCGRLCPRHRLCEGACTLRHNGGAVTIGAIEQAVADAVLAEGFELPRPAALSYRRVAVVGSGPAGLACADFLNRAGVAVTVYDRAEEIGGLLARGVPPFKLEREVLARRKAQFEAAGIRFVLGTGMDGERLARLLADNDAVFLGLGAQTPRAVELPGTHLDGVHQALDWLGAFNAGRGGALAGRRVCVLGGGDTATDAARAAVRAGASPVTVLARRHEEQLRASPHDLKAAREEGVHFHFLHRPLAIEGNGVVNGVRFATHRGERVEPADAVVLAFGFEPHAPHWLAAQGIAVRNDGRIETDANGRTTHARVYAGGDGAHGPNLAVTAMADGRRAAEAILASFRVTTRARAALRSVAMAVRATPAMATAEN